MEILTWREFLDLAPVAQLLDPGGSETSTLGCGCPVCGHFISVADGHIDDAPEYERCSRMMAAHCRHFHGWKIEDLSDS